MSDAVEVYINDLFKDYEKDRGPKESDVRFNVVVPASTGRRLKFCLNHVSLSRHSFVVDAIHVVLFEMEKKLGLVEEKEGQFDWVQAYHDDVILPPDDLAFRKEYGTNKPSLNSLRRGKVNE